jgi:hypothetical protein
MDRILPGLDRKLIYQAGLKIFNLGFRIGGVCKPVGVHDFIKNNWEECLKFSNHKMKQSRNLLSFLIRLHPSRVKSSGLIMIILYR